MKDKRKESLRCKQIKKNGEQCRALANRNTGLCAVHSGSKPRLNTEIDPDQGVVHIKKYLVRLMLDTRKGKIKPQTTNAIANLVDKLLKCHEIIENEVEIQELKAMLEEYKAGSVEFADAQYMGTLESKYDTEK